MTKRIMRSFRLNEVSAVDNPAQAHAKATIIKRADEVEYWKRDFTAEQRRQLAQEGKAKPDGSYPIVTEGDLKNAISAWGRGGATASDKAWIIRRAKALGATDKLPDGWVSKSNQEVDDMTTDELKKMIGEHVATATADLTKQLKAANDQIAKMGAKNKTLPQADPEDNEPDEDDMGKRSAWKAYAAKQVEKAVAKTKADIEKRDADDEVIKVGDAEFRKSTDPAVFAIMKAQQDQFAKLSDESELKDLTKRAETELSALPGEAVAKGKMLRAIAKMGEDERKTLETALKAGNAAIKAGFSEIGKTTIVEGSATDKLDKLADEHAKQHNVTKAVAYDAVLKTDTGRQLYAETRKERPTARMPN